jgi:hypothetical protein
MWAGTYGDGGCRLAELVVSRNDGDEAGGGGGAECRLNPRV